MNRQIFGFSFAILALVALTGCGGGGGESATSTRTLLTGGSSKVWRVSLIDANRNFSGGDDDRGTYTACPRSYSRIGGGAAWACSASDTITFREDGTADYFVGESDDPVTWSLSGSTLTIDFGGSLGTKITDTIEVVNSGRLVLRRVNRVVSGATQTTEAGSAFVIVHP